MRASLLLSALLLLACGRAAVRADSNDSLPAADTAGITRVALERTACFGTCPDYLVTLNADGSASYRGGRFAPRHGDFHATVSSGEFGRMVRRINELGFFAMDTAYTQNVTDLPSFTLTVTSGTGGHAVLCYGFGCPPAFHELIALVDSVADGLTWDSLPAAR